MQTKTGIIISTSSSGMLLVSMEIPLSPCRQYKGLILCVYIYIYFFWNSPMHTVLSLCLSPTSKPLPPPTLLSSPTRSLLISHGIAEARSSRFYTADLALTPPFILARWPLYSPFPEFRGLFTLWSQGTARGWLAGCVVLYEYRVHGFSRSVIIIYTLVWCCDVWREVYTRIEPTIRPCITANIYHSFDILCPPPPPPHHPLCYGGYPLSDH